MIQTVSALNFSCIEIVSSLGNFVTKYKNIYLPILTKKKGRKGGEIDIFVIFYIIYRVS